MENEKPESQEVIKKCTHCGTEFKATGPGASEIPVCPGCY